MMKILSKAVGELVQEEYSRASEQHGAHHHSPHEAYAVIKEELEEAQHEIAIVEDKLNHDFWKAVRTDDVYGCKVNAEIIQKRAEAAAAEMIQVAAMALKAQQGFEEE